MNTLFKYTASALAGAVLLFAAGCGPSHRGDPAWVYIEPNRAAYYPQDCAAAPRDGDLYELEKVLAQGYKLADACSGEPVAATPKPAPPSMEPADSTYDAEPLRRAAPAAQPARRPDAPANAKPKTGVRRWGNRDYLAE